MCQKNVKKLQYRYCKACCKSQGRLRRATGCNKASESLRREYILQLAAAKDDAGNIPAATLLRNMNRIEAQRQLFRNFRYIAGSTTQVHLPLRLQMAEPPNWPNATKEKKALMADNKRKFCHTEGGSKLLSDRYGRDVRKFGDGPAVKEVFARTN